MRKILIIFVSFLVLVDLAFLHWGVFLRGKEANQEILIPEPTIIPAFCPNSCLSAISEATSSLKLVTSVIIPTPSPTSIPPLPLVKEFYIPLGSGVSKADDWENISSALAYIDSAKYGKIKSVVFEVIAHIPNGNQGAFIRLYNVTDKHSVWSSDVYLEGGQTQLLTSQSVNLGSGNKLYQIQAKTTLKYDVVIDLARIKITTE